MPIYEYTCKECGADTEAIQGINDPPLTECEHCGGELRKRLSAPAFQFKGSGWYVTDYARKDGGKDRGGESSKSSTASSGSESSKSESKTEGSKSDSATKSTSQEKSA